MIIKNELIMKKRYFKPEMLIEQMEPEEMIAVSLLDGDANGNDALGRDFDDPSDEANPLLEGILFN